MIAEISVYLFVAFLYVWIASCIWFDNIQGGGVQ